jgi:hypothetical protein
MPSEYHLAVRAILNAVDPLRLIAMDAPEDEYDNIVHELIKWRKPVTAEQVSRALTGGFGMPVTDMDAAALAARINAERDRHLPP